MATKRATKKKPAKKKKRSVSKKARRPAKRAAAKKKAKKKVVRRKAAKKKVTTKKAKKKVAKKKAGKKKVAKKKAAKKRPAKKKKRTAKRHPGPSAAAIGAELDKRMDQLTRQLADVRDFAEKELKKQRKGFDELVSDVRKEQANLSKKLGEFIKEHDTLKEITSSVSETAKDIEDRIRKAVSKVTESVSDRPSD